MWSLLSSPPNPVDIIAVIGAVLSSFACCISLLSLLFSGVALWISVQDELTPEVEFSIKEDSFSVINKPAELTVNIRNLGKRPLTNSTFLIIPQLDEGFRNYHYILTLAPNENTDIDIGPDIYSFLQKKGILSYSDAGNALHGPTDMEFYLELRYKAKVGIIGRNGVRKCKIKLVWSGNKRVDKWDIESERV